MPPSAATYSTIFKIHSIHKNRPTLQLWLARCYPYRKAILSLFRVSGTIRQNEVPLDHRLIDFDQILPPCDRSIIVAALLAAELQLMIVRVKVRVRGQSGLTLAATRNRHGI